MLRSRNMKSTPMIMNYPWAYLFANYNILAVKAGYKDVKDAVEKMNAHTMTPDTFENMLLAKTE